MTQSTKLPTLPSDTATQLVALKGTCPEDFYALVRALRNEGWPLRAIAAPFSMSRTAAQGWEAKYTEGTPLPEVPELPVVPVEDRKNSAKRYTLTEEEVKNLYELAEEASTVRRYTDANAPSRRAASELESKLIEYSSRGISRTQLAAYCGVSDSSIKQRLRKYN